MIAAFTGVSRESRQGFTILELMTVILIIAIMAVLLFPALSSVRSRTEKTQCMANLRSLYGGAEAYLQQNGKWPQIDTRLITKGNEYDKAWIAALEPFNIGRKNWICPTFQKSAGDPDYTKDASARVDYIATPFDDKTITPHRWPTQPWFVERPSPHGNGNLIIFTDGHIAELNDYAKPKK